MEPAQFAGRKARLRTLFEDMITAFGAKQFDRFEAFLRDDTVFEWPYVPLKDFPARMVGGKAFRKAAEIGMAECDPYGHVVDRFYDQLDPDLLIVEYHSDTIHHPSRKRYANKYLGILRYEGDRVVWWREYINPLPVLEVYGADFQNEAASVGASRGGR